MGGELGSLVASMAERAGWVGDVMGFDVDPPRRLLQRSRFVRVDPEDSGKIEQLVVDFDPHVILHVGVWEPHARLATNEARRCTEAVAKDVFDAAHRAPSLETVVVRSGIEIYGAGSHAPAIATETTTALPDTVYGHMCRTIESQATELRTARGVNVCVLRLAPVLGPHVPSPLGRLLRLPMVPIRGMHNPVFSVVEDHDAATAFIQAGERNANGTVNIVANGAISLLRTAVIGNRVPLFQFGPAWWMARRVAAGAGAPIPDHVESLLRHGRLAASNEAAHLLRFAPRHSTVQVIERLYQWPAIERIPARVPVA